MPQRSPAAASTIFSSARSTLIVLLVAILGVAGLDTTALVAAPHGSTTTGTTLARPASADSPVLKVLHWSGRYWLVFPHAQGGPEHSPLSNAHSSAWVDHRGRLHLRVHKIGHVWRSVELESLLPVTYGAYRFVTTSSPGRLASPIVLGMFVFRTGAARFTNEIDLEDSHSLVHLNRHRDAQYVVQPYTAPHHIHRYAIPHGLGTTLQQFTWTPGRVSFVTRAGATRHARRINHFHYSGSDVPTPEGEHLYINLYLHHTRHHRGGTVKPGHGARTIILKSFRYLPY